jgi:primary-amine oxidase
VIEIRRPNKTVALQFLDEGGSANPPHRFARVTVKRNSVKHPRIEEHSVGPFPVDHETRIQPLSFPYNSGRSWSETPTPDANALFKWMDEVGEEVADMVNDIFGPLFMLSPLCLV